ncbi:MAG: tRNA (adenosine(37)-N6)-threonylcarbamoyltransferase complex ATPase subunit type 1 TsaE [Candidatus Moraniibacteriota bacterium]
MTQTFTTHSAEETREVGRNFARTLKPGTLVCFEGNLGAGKTTFIQGLLEGLGAEKPFVSPTFILMKQYDLTMPTESGIKYIYHADAYRLGAPEFREIGFEEWISDPDGVTLLEWPNRIAELLPEKRIEISLRTLSENEREISVESIGEPV